MARIIEEKRLLERFPPLKDLMLLSGHLRVLDIDETWKPGRVLVTVSNGRGSFRINYPANDF